MTTEIIEETTVVELKGCRVAMASMVFDGDYALPHGKTGRGLSCVLVLLDPGGDDVWVGRGSVVNIHGLEWKVVDINKTGNENGSVALQYLGRLNLWSLSKHYIAWWRVDLPVPLNTIWPYVVDAGNDTGVWVSESDATVANPGQGKTLITWSNGDALVASPKQLIPDICAAFEPAIAVTTTGAYLNIFMSTDIYLPWVWTPYNDDVFDPGPHINIFAVENAARFNRFLGLVREKCLGLGGQWTLLEP